MNNLIRTQNKTIIINNKTYNLSLEYILGLFEGDGSITIQLKPNKSHKTGKQIILIFEIHQHVIDVDLLKAISVYLDCGKVEIVWSSDRCGGRLLTRLPSTAIRRHPECLLIVFLILGENMV